MDHQSLQNHKICVDHFGSIQNQMNQLEKQLGSLPQHLSQNSQGNKANSIESWRSLNTYLATSCASSLKVLTSLIEVCADSAVKEDRLKKEPEVNLQPPRTFDGYPEPLNKAEGLGRNLPPAPLSYATGSVVTSQHNDVYPPHYGMHPQIQATSAVLSAPSGQGHSLSGVSYARPLPQVRQLHEVPDMGARVAHPVSHVGGPTTQPGTMASPTAGPGADSQEGKEPLSGKEQQQQQSMVPSAVEEEKSKVGTEQEEVSRSETSKDTQSSKRRRRESRQEISTDAQSPVRMWEEKGPEPSRDTQSPKGARRESRLETSDAQSPKSTKRPERPESSRDAQSPKRMRGENRQEYVGINSAVPETSQHRPEPSMDTHYTQTFKPGMSRDNQFRMGMDSQTFSTAQAVHVPAFGNFMPHAQTTTETASEFTHSYVPPYGQSKAHTLPQFPKVRARDSAIAMQTDTGWEWRKYGQKNLKDPRLYRSYFRCAEKTCTAKKMLDFYMDGQLVKEELMGHHNHPQPSKTARVRLVYNKDSQKFENVGNSTHSMEGLGSYGFGERPMGYSPGMSFPSTSGPSQNLHYSNDVQQQSSTFMRNMDVPSVASKKFAGGTSDSAQRTSTTLDSNTPTIQRTDAAES